MTRFLRYLRIAFSATCLIACVLLCVLWVRSYSYYDQVSIPISANRIVGCGSKSGTFAISTTNDPMMVKWVGGKCKRLTVEIEEIKSVINYKPPGVKKFRLIFPYVVVMPASIICAAAPWIHWTKRFSLRTMLITTTLVAVVLGFWVWARQ